jgi:hypothetical protein
MNFRNICDSQFRIEISGREHTRANDIEAGSPDKPASGRVLCRPDDGCETADWKFK